MSQQITLCLWFDGEGEAAAKFYTSIFPNSKIIQKENYSVENPSEKPVGSTMTVAFSIDGFEFLALNGGPYFKINPSISFHVKCKTKAEVDSIWEKLSPGAKVLMPLNTYPFSERYGWLEDKFGVSWQIIHVKEDFKDKFTPVLMFTQSVNGRTEEAVNFYASIFKKSKINSFFRYQKGEPNKEGNIKYADFSLLGQNLGAMDGGDFHKFTFNEGISLMINCADQKEMDHYYDKLSFYPESEMCGWIKDKFGVSWQLIPQGFEKLVEKEGVMEAVLKMKRLDLKKLESIAAKK